MGTAVNLYYTYSTAIGAKWELIPSKLLVVEDIASYLGTKDKKTISDFQYIKNELEISINVEIAQSYSQPRSATNFKYVSIQNPDEAIHYYFVKKATWRSKTCVRFELVMDVLNTFQEGRDFNFKPNTRIVREHKDRFSAKTTIEYKYENNIASVGSMTIGEKVYIAETPDFDPVFEGILRGIGYNALHEYYYVIIEFNYRLTMDNFNDWLSQVESEEENIMFFQDQENYAVGEVVYLEDEPDFESYRIIDEVNEGISPVLQCQSAEGNKIENPTSLLAQNWYLLYRNQNDPSDSLTNPVNCYLIPENKVQTNAGYIESGRLVPSWLEDGYWYFFSVRSENDFILSNGVNVEHYSLSSYAPILMITKAGNKISVQYLRGRSDSFSGVIEIMWSYDDIDYIDITGLPAIYNSTNTSPYISNYQLATMSFPYNFTNSGTFNEVDNINNLDKGDPKNIKLIKLPYCPYNFTITANVIQIADDSNWEFASFSQQSGGDMYALKLKDMNLKLSATINEEDNQPLPSLLFEPDNPSITDSRRGYEYESKLFHSDFYQPTYVYDSFTYKVQMEKLDISSYTSLNSEKMTIKFDMTRTINSRFMFTFDNLYFKIATENYAKYMPIARNNEVVLYNVSYLNYIRTGFNYDVKAKERANVSNAIGMGLSIASTASALLLPSVPLKVAGVIAGMVSIAMSIKSTIVSAQQNEDSIRRKLTETANQTASVAGSDDVDLMSVYAGNRLKYLVYEPTPLMKSILFDLFFYAGYASGRMGIPNHNTRVNFDYLECEASLENEGSIPDDCLQELLNCFKTGVCYLHKTNRGSNKWDFEQKYENWEKSVLEG